MRCSSSSEDGTQTATGFLLGESTEQMSSSLSAQQQSRLNNLKISPNATKGDANKAMENNAVPEQNDSLRRDAGDDLRHLRAEQGRAGSVHRQTGVRASMVCFALELLGYKASLIHLE